jgi:hypothetical protein
LERLFKEYQKRTELNKMELKIVEIENINKELFD